ncbi:hypothetical protein N2152v2_002486 [Parachlorella kessleri]
MVRHEASSLRRYAKRPLFYEPPSASNATSARTLALLALLLCLVLLAKHRRAPAPRTLVVYVFADVDPAYRENLQYFLQVGVVEDPRVDYVLILQQDTEDEPHMATPAVKNLQVVRHKNECFDLGTLGWFFNSGLKDTSPYKYFVFLNASVRGPFLPAYWPKGALWTEAFTGKLTDTVKLVGTTINCGGIVVDGLSRANPHVQTFAMATDAVGLAVIRADPRALGCYDSKWRTILWGELGISDAILRAGYGLDSLMLRYQGVDWRRPENWGCNAGMNPFIDGAYDGISLSPLEQMFVKVKWVEVRHELTAAATAVAYSRWKLRQDDINTNAWQFPRASQVWRIEALSRSQPACLDAQHYLQANPDLPQSWDRQQVWEYFVLRGQFEAREFRFRCPLDWGSLTRQAHTTGFQAAAPLRPAAAVGAASSGGSGGSRLSRTRQAWQQHLEAAKAGGGVAAGADGSQGAQQAQQQRGRVSLQPHAPATLAPAGKAQGSLPRPASLCAAGDGACSRRLAPARWQGVPSVQAGAGAAARAAHALLHEEPR